MTSQTLTCVHGPADGAVVDVAENESIVRVPATHVPGLVGIYRRVESPPDGGAPRLRYDYAVEFDHEGERYICHEVVAAPGVRKAEGLTAAPDVQIRWTIRVSHRTCEGDVVRHESDFAAGSDLIPRMVRAARGAGPCESVRDGRS